MACGFVQAIFMPRNDAKTGLWLIGACGRVGSTVALGMATLARRSPDQTGLVTALPVFADVELPRLDRIVFGGHEVRHGSLRDELSAAYRQAGLFSHERLRDAAVALRGMQRNVRPGTLCGASTTVQRLADADFPPRDGSPAAAVERLADDLRRFRSQHRLTDVIVINVASSEPPAPRSVMNQTPGRLAASLARRGAIGLPSSSLYALAAIEAGCPYVNFTPSAGIDLGALRQRAVAAKLPFMGRDGKTGETLVKSALAPMFAMRNLSVLSWVGQNILGNRDGEVLRDPKTLASKIKTKDGLISRIVGGRPTTHVRIDYVPSLDDWKVAWDYVHFQGFLGTKMSMQFTWQGCDSILAAPLVLDLFRLTALAHRRGQVGPMKHLAFFFKDPMDVAEHDLHAQWRTLVDHVVQPERPHRLRSRAGLGQSPPSRNARTLLSVGGEVRARGGGRDNR